MEKLMTRSIEDMVKSCNKQGDDLSNRYMKNKDLKVNAAAMNNYKTAILALKTQLIYKKLTGAPSKIEFLEK